MKKEKMIMMSRFKFLPKLFNTSLNDLIIYVRRIYYMKFKKEYILKSVANRKGHCTYQKCGDVCCFHCREYNKETKECVIYGSHPTSCRISPFDEKDKTLKLKYVCGFNW